MMDDEKLRLTTEKYRLPYHWIRDPLSRYSLPYFGYAEIVLSALPPAPAEVFDVGCGDGRVSSLMADKGYHVTGTELLRQSVEYAQILEPRGTFYEGNFCRDIFAELPIKESAYDAAIMIEVYEHIPPDDCRRALKNIHKLLKPGGMAIVSVPSKQLPLSKLHYRHFDIPEFRAELEDAGFRVDKVIRQHSLGKLCSTLLADRMERFLDNNWFQPVVLKRLRKKLYMKYCNAVAENRSCGRYIAVARKEASP